ncbi:hypothetical protein HHK36_018183 [Tetracentron sinense]|uniref:Exoribonuclease phosphorolytic domain-containing protein n=1 Tax=Tetracentron sinense TaxID=13715 RepID=A0A835DDS1_TETSI|nr:hypothetical protein HHK36_018183 [Tetracentron sinense]
MMEELKKLVESSSDGSAKLRVFLFSATELDQSGIMHFGDLHDCGKKYVDAVNGISNFVASGIMRKESMTSATSTQNSDSLMSGAEPWGKARSNSKEPLLGPHSWGSDHKEFSSMLHKALEGAIILETFPKTTVDVFALVLESGGSDLPVVISCASLALADAGIMMFDLVTSVSVAMELCLNACSKLGNIMRLCLEEDASAPQK